ncbi:uncharacterized protein OCT59_000247 [Rhizophagus irregularis]|uniref:Uncharacterized protein n=1 Tax=Rhizophagus irregularis (strain DAOM 181602 / DAOM 197198 / MUCL 43194) TaxID=747089 RepID=U9SYU8_RHIID|nr:hypothetical protein GLOIN_2v1774265 [Rhizophagus irregularis DAOM 181602=DAOM 197198]POG71881.1 hypothetical protein GLOIN_2v1774265 [Rhizophagus irregularis DAOM 181602=DAOM 197198]UZN98964.1 hypothetical protein OCT59_000247 [Rhizophagus irregularis]GBC49808.1 hypothetical protein GLOIN_2v1774265 [Rhizophagus irregularis DAOM 181602=DAOM 197198]CAG8583973.1 15442_t:CDS:2 [Rhizophagus irregularis]|eukprot:XP_025178747.1 hypothetical protein GLOIN_2v1774265 [Rhizophagus irregularis DAOM 181602=DAOM 197198]
MKFKEKIFILIFILFSIIITLTFLVQENPYDVLPEKTIYDQNPVSTNHTKEDKELPKEANVLENVQKSQSPIKPIETRPTHVSTATMDNSSTINLHINASPTNNDVAIATIDDSKSIVKIATIDDSKSVVKIATIDDSKSVVKIATIDDSKNVTIATIDSSKDSKDSSGAVAPVDNLKNKNNSSEESAGIDSPKDTNNSSAEIADVDSSKDTKNYSAKNDDDDNTSREL